MEYHKAYALVTGSSHGIGRAIAIKLAKEGNNVLLVALDNDELYATKKEIEGLYSVLVDALGTDLTLKDSSTKVFEWCTQNDYQISLLINNAGFGKGGLFGNPFFGYLSQNDRFE